jgi:glyoxylase-like metal-dependent hydrolase (beta-lactamase superfamily II)
MTRKFTGLLSLVLVVPLSLAAQDVKTVLQAASKAMGDVRSIQYSGTGHLDALGQAYSPSSAWPQNNITSYTRTIDYGSRSSKEELTQVEPTPPRLGGAAPFAGEQKQINLVSGQYAWNQEGNASQPAVATAEERYLQIWLTPHGFLKAATENNATAKKGSGGTIVSFTSGKFKINGTIDSQNMVTRTETWIANPVLGDMPVETTYSGYKDFNGVKFPTMIVQKQGGYPVLDLAVTSVQPNVSLNLPVPEAARTTTLPPVKVTSQKLADGIWFLAGGSHNSVLVGYPTYLVMIEAPLDEARSTAVIAEAKKLVPNKPIKYLINTHHHFDHSGGLRTYVAEGATIITNEINKAYYEQVWKAPRTLDPDRLAQSPKKPTYITVKGKYTLADGGRSLEIYPMEGDTHNSGLMMVYMPKEKILVEADDFSWPAGTRAGPRYHVNNVNLYRNIQHLNLDVNTIAPIHGEPVSLSELQKAATS